MENFSLGMGFLFGMVLGSLLFAWDKIETGNDDYKIAQCVELKKSLEEQLADTSKKEDLQRKLEQLEKWETAK